MKRNGELLAKATRQPAAASSRSALRPSASIETKIAEQQRLLSSIKGEIARIVAAERARGSCRWRAAAQARLARSTACRSSRRSDTVVGASAVAPQSSHDASRRPRRTAASSASRCAQLGTPYVWGGARPAASTARASSRGPSRRSASRCRTRRTRSTAWACPVSSDQLQPGDLVFFDGLGHVGIYIGGGQFVHAPHTGDVVKISSLGEGWYSSTYVGARRIL